MFKNYEHFKKATKELFEQSKSQKLNLSQFREAFSKSLGFTNQSSLKSNFEKEQNTLEVFNIVSVICYCNETISWKKDFLDTPEGNKAAEKLFTEALKEATIDIDTNESYLTLEDIESHIEDGYFGTSYDDFGLFIVHSS